MTREDQRGMVEEWLPYISHGVTEGIFFLQNFFGIGSGSKIPGSHTLFIGLEMAD